MNVPKNSLDDCRAIDDPKRLAYASHPCPKPVGESSAWPTDDPNAAQVIVCTEMLLSTNS